MVEIPGWYEDCELSLLETCARSAPADLPVVEVGVAHGRSASVLSRAGDLRLILVDDLSFVDGRGTWPPHAKSFRTVDDMSAETPAIGMLHHDASHAADIVLRHLLLLLPKIPVDGIVCLHDFWSDTYPGVREAWRRVTLELGARDGQAWKTHGQASTLQAFWRVQ